MNIRLCSINDRNNWIRLNRAFMAYEMSDEGFWNNADAISDEQFGTIFKVALKNPELITMMMIEEEKEAVGFANLMTIFSVWAHGKALILDDLFICDEHRGKGLGRQALAYIENYAKENGYKRLQFQSEFSNPVAYEFYTKLGYKSADMHFFVKNFNEADKNEEGEIS
ncbi:MAG: GNAT family N-acetyltransferase [Sedimentibacter sp.]|uniref:GNAT family N-acetyltransferase n=1 Tax=Sedimentibacter sp. TaxID=1960295 RepID=UPI00315905FA